MPRPALETLIVTRQLPTPLVVEAAHLRVLRAWIKLVENTELRYAEGLHREIREEWRRHCVRHLTPSRGPP